MSEEWEKTQIRNAREHFRNFQADWRNYGDLQTLDCRNRNGNGEYSVRCIFDSRQQCMHISGGLEFACFRLEMAREQVRRMDPATRRGRILKPGQRTKR